MFDAGGFVVSLCVCLSISIHTWWKLYWLVYVWEVYDRPFVIYCASIYVANLEF